MKSLDEKMAIEFGISEIGETNIPAKVDIESHPENKSIDKNIDYALARENIHNLLIKSNHALDNLMELAEDQPNPRVFEVTGNLIKTISDTTKDLFEIHKNNEEIGSQTINNNLNITSAELLKMIKDN
jgi:hypothetical protein